MRKKNQLKKSKLNGKKNNITKRNKKPLKKSNSKKRRNKKKKGKFQIIMKGGSNSLTQTLQQAIINKFNDKRKKKDNKIGISEYTEYDDDQFMYRYNKSFPENSIFFPSTIEGVMEIKKGINQLRFVLTLNDIFISDIVSKLDSVSYMLSQEKKYVLFFIGGGDCPEELKLYLHIKGDIKGAIENEQLINNPFFAGKIAEHFPNTSVKLNFSEIQCVVIDFDNCLANGHLTGEMKKQIDRQSGELLLSIAKRIIREHMVKETDRKDMLKHIFKNILDQNKKIVIASFGYRDLIKEYLITILGQFESNIGFLNDEGTLHKGIFITTPSDVTNPYTKKNYLENNKIPDGKNPQLDLIVEKLDRVNKNNIIFFDDTLYNILLASKHGYPYSYNVYPFPEITQYSKKISIRPFEKYFNFPLNYLIINYYNKLIEIEKEKKTTNPLPLGPRAIEEFEGRNKIEIASDDIMIDEDFMEYIYNPLIGDDSKIIEHTSDQIINRQLEALKKFYAKSFTHAGFLKISNNISSPSAPKTLFRIFEKENKKEIEKFDLQLTNCISGNIKSYFVKENEKYFIYFVGPSCINKYSKPN